MSHACGKRAHRHHFFVVLLLRQRIAKLSSTLRNALLEFRGVFFNICFRQPDRAGLFVEDATCLANHNVEDAVQGPHCQDRGAHEQGILVHIVAVVPCDGRVVDGNNGDGGSSHRTPEATISSTQRGLHIEVCIA